MQQQKTCSKTKITYWKVTIRLRHSMLKILSKRQVEVFTRELKVCAKIITRTELSNLKWTRGEQSQKIKTPANKLEIKIMCNFRPTIPFWKSRVFHQRPATIIRMAWQIYSLTKEDLRRLIRVIWLWIAVSLQDWDQSSKLKRSNNTTKMLVIEFTQAINECALIRVTKVIWVFTTA